MMMEKYEFMEGEGCTRIILDNHYQQENIGNY